jgi:hypothetical protein
MFNALFATKLQLKYLFMAAIGLLSPIKYLLVLVGLFILMDTILGIWNAKKQQIKITSAKLSAVLSKMFVYQAIVILAYIIDVNLLGGIVGLFVDVPLIVTKIATLMVLVNESYSIDEKIRSLNDEKGIWFYFTRSLKVAKVLKKETKDLIGDLDKDEEKPKLDKDDKGELIG